MSPVFSNFEENICLKVSRKKIFLFTNNENLNKKMKSENSHRK